MRLHVEELESRDCPAPLLPVTAAQMAAIHDAAGFDLEAGPGTAVQLPPAAGPKVAVLIPLPQELDAFIDGYANVLVAVEDGICTEAWWGIDEVMAQDYADAHGLTLYAPVLEATSGQLTVAPVLIDTLLASEPGHPFDGAWLASELGTLPTALAVQSAPGEPFLLTFAVAEPLGGFRLHTLTSQDDGILWTMTEVQYTDTLTPALGLWELTTVV